LLKILHFADLHLGASFKRFGQKGGKLREGLKHTLANIVKTAQSEGAALVVIAGDLTDSNKVAPATIDYIIRQLNKLDMPVVILPGTHDCLEKSSVFNRQEWSNLQNVYIFRNENGQTFNFLSLSLAVHGKANKSNKSTTSPLNGLQADPGYRWNIAVAHGSLQIKGKSSEEDYPITFDDLANCDMDYVALGHWHEYFEHRSSKTMACYSGSASTMSFSTPDSGTVNLVELADEGVTVRRLPVAYHKWFSTDCTLDSLEEVLRENAGPQSLASLRLDEAFDTAKAALLDELYSRYSDEYFYLDIECNRAVDSEVEIDPAAFPENTFAGQFIRLALKAIETAKPEEKPIAKKVLDEGYKILITGEVS